MLKIYVCLKFNMANPIFHYLHNITDCRWTGTACTVDKPLVLTQLSGKIGSPTVLDVGYYPPTSHCMWKITVPKWMVRAHSYRTIAKATAIAITFNLGS